MSQRFRIVPLRTDDLTRSVTQRALDVLRSGVKRPFAHATCPVCRTGFEADLVAEPTEGALYPSPTGAHYAITCPACGETEDRVEFRF
jgi:hypothetical protein